MKGRSDEGASSIEYGLILFAIAAAVVTITVGLGIVTKSTYHSSCDTISAEISGGAC